MTMKFLTQIGLKKILLIGIPVILVGLFGYRFVSIDRDIEETADSVPTVSVMSVTSYQEEHAGIRAIGEVEALEDVEVKSQVAANVEAVYVDLGDEVTQGQLLLELDHDALDAQLAQASASISRMQSSVNQTIAGATNEEIAQAKAAVDTAEASLAQAQAQLDQTVSSTAFAVSSAEIALQIAESNLESATLSNDQSLEDAVDDALDVANGAVLVAENTLATLTDFQYLYFFGSNSISADLANKKEIVVSLLLGQDGAGKWNNEFLAELSGGVKGEVSTLVADSDVSDTRAEDMLENMEAMLEYMQDALNTLQGAMSSSLASAATTTDKTTVSNLRISIDAEQASVTNALQQIISARLDLGSGEESYTLAYEQALQQLADAQASLDSSVASAQALVDIQTAALAQTQAAYDAALADPRDVDLAGLYASVSEAQASYSLIAANIEHYEIRAPFDGVIGSIPLTTGELVTAGQRLVSLVNDGGYQVRTYVNESDRKMLAVGDQVLVQGGASGLVTNIAPGIDPVTKKVEVIIAITQSESTLVIGEFVEVDIIAQEQDGDEVYLLPFKAIKNTTDAAFVFTVENGVIEQHEIELGAIVGESVEVLSGLDPEWEILSSTRGLKAGQVVDVQ